MKERFVTTCLAVFDRLMDLVTFGRWTRAQGDVSWRVMKVKE